MNENTQHSPGPWSKTTGFVHAGRAVVAVYVPAAHSCMRWAEQPGSGALEANGRLIAIATHAPHECDDPKCPGNVNRRRLAAFDDLAAALEAALKLLVPFRTSQRTPREAFDELMALLDAAKARAESSDNA